MQSIFQQLLPALLALLCSASASFSAEPILRITSPADGTVVQPGEKVRFNVEAFGGPMASVIIIAETPIGWSQSLTAPPYEFTIRIPPRISLRTYQFTALGVVKPGESVYSKSISLDVDRTERPVSTHVQPRVLSLSVGGQGYLQVTGTYSDGSTSNITQSKSTEYVSRSPSVATVKGDGRVTAVGPGSTQIVINGDCIVPVTVSKSRK